MKAHEIAAKAADLVGGDRARQHGGKTENHRNIAAMWNAYLGWRLVEGGLLTPRDVALMMALLKIARTKAGSHNPDDYVDLCGYGAIAGQIAEGERAKQGVDVAKMTKDGEKIAATRSAAPNVATCERCGATAAPGFTAVCGWRNQMKQPQDCLAAAVQPPLTDAELLASIRHHVDPRPAPIGETWGRMK